MRHLFMILFLISLIIPSRLYAQGGDIAFWIPESGLTSESDTQVQRNGDYFSIKIHSVYAYYKSGFFENIKKLIVVSETSIVEAGKPPIQSTMINKVWQRLDKSGDFIGVNDHLVVLSPAMASNIQLKVSFRGIGEDRFKMLFEALSEPSFKAALGLSPATSATISAIAPTVQKLVASPYTSNDPRQILDINQSYVVYPEKNVLRRDSLREGFLVIMSSREGKSDELTKILSLGTKDIRLSSLGDIGLEYKEGSDWKPFRNNSYVILSVTKTPVRGENQYSNWFLKYCDAERIAEEKLLSGEPLDRVKPEVIGLWREGNALLFADSNYIQSEKASIKNKHLKDLQTVLLAMGNQPAMAKVDAKALGVPSNFAELAGKYEAAVKREAAQVTVKAQGSDGKPLQINFSLSGLDSPAQNLIIKSTNKAGEAVIKGLPPGKYKIETQGDSKNSEIFIVDPKDKKSLAIK